VLRTHVEIATLENDVETLIEWIAGQPGGVADETGLRIGQLEPLAVAIRGLVNRLTKRPVTVSSQSQTDKADPVVADETELPETPRQSTMNGFKLTDSRMLSRDMEHLRTIQKEVRGLFRTAADSRDGSVDNTHHTFTSQASSHATSHATKISRLLGMSPEKTEIGGLSQLTLSPGTELMDNPWFSSRPLRRRRSGSLPPPSLDEVITDSPVSTIAPVSAAVTTRELFATDDSLTVSALHAAMARRRAPSVGGRADLAGWLKKQETKKRIPTSIYSRKRSDSVTYRN
jgi:hypothetical protein